MKSGILVTKTTVRNWEVSVILTGPNWSVLLKRTRQHKLCSENFHISSSVLGKSLNLCKHLERTRVVENCGISQHETIKLFTLVIKLEERNAWNAIKLSCKFSESCLTTIDCTAFWLLISEDFFTRKHSSSSLSWLVCSAGVKLYLRHFAPFIEQKRQNADPYWRAWLAAWGVWNTLFPQLHQDKKFCFTALLLQNQG